VGGGQFINRPETVQLFGRTITFLGGADLAMQVIIWSIPIGFVNSVTQFVLIAVNQQRYLTKAFLIGVVFNVVGNLIFIPTFGYVGAAIVTIFSEFSLLFPFYYSVRRHVGVVPWFSLCAAPVAATVAMGLGILGLTNLSVNLWVAVALGWGVYLVALVATGAFRNEDMAVVWRALPVGPLKKLLPSHG
jgi:O-antigen/teichoic acid export membrane protein